MKCQCGKEVPLVIAGRYIENNVDYIYLQATCCSCGLTEYFQEFITGSLKKT